MKIVTDSGMDLYFPPEDMPNMKEIHIVRHIITLDGKGYRSGLDLHPEDLYQILRTRETYPGTSLPPVGEFVRTYQEITKDDPDVLSIHMSSGLSGTVNAANTAKKMVDKNIVVYDSKTLSAALGWQVQAAYRALKAGWPTERIIALMEKIGAATDSIYTLDELKYLIHGGRISHMSAVIANALKIKPLIGVEKEFGKYARIGKERKFKNAVKGLVKIVSKKYKKGTPLRTQVLHAYNPDAAYMLRDMIDKKYECKWLPTFPMSPVLGAHTGPSMVGIAFAPLEIFEEVP